MKIPVGGIGCICALGGNTEEIKNNLFNSAASSSLPINRLNSFYSKSYPVYQAPAEILKSKNKDESFGFLFLRLAIEEALEQSGLTKTDLKKVRVGIIAGTSVNASFNCFDFYKDWRGGKEVSFEPLLYYLNTPLSRALQKYYGVQGPQMTITTACASGTDAVGIAAQCIERDLCDVVIACATDEINLIPFIGFIRLMIASSEPCMPFSLDRKGINLGEGAGVLILQSPKFLKERKTDAKGYILGYGTCADAYHPTAPDPNGIGLKRALNMAMKNAGIKKNEIAFINAHGTGTQDNDAAEAKVFNEVLKDVPVMASKSHTGHTLGAAGAVEAVLSLICLNVGEIAKTARFKAMDPALNIKPVTENTKISKDKKIALSDSLSFGGCNSVIALGCARYEDG
ncbi:MAG: beta-ketoacyl-[acyl-carrier-protein] synthase family protein [Elusimicrobiota bacterium]|jgi:3-oxoacyl-[acyl-carrier-protein] synthase-1/3-oxoacyl-[acyl-carrier-protein] synthase II|nr:beta-ketoacyl-[acyl-carrier-protein] synthase family protein [Elusimicrobiota bacterium]